MGQSTSTVARKITKSVSSMFSSKQEEDDVAETSARFAVTPFVFKRTGSMYFDEDGDLAHEFYEEIYVGHRAIMKQSWQNLRPQGDVELSHPRICTDFPVIICKAPYS